MLGMAWRWATVDCEASDKKKRLLLVTPGNIRNSHLYVRKHYDFFPPDCVGPSRKRAKGTNGDIEILLDGLNEAVKTDIGRNAKTGAPPRRCCPTPRDSTPRPCPARPGRSSAPTVLG